MKAKARENLAAGWPRDEDGSSNGLWVSSRPFSETMSGESLCCSTQLWSLQKGFTLGLCCLLYLACSWMRIFSSSLFLQSFPFAASRTSAAEGWCWGAAPCRAWSRRGALLRGPPLGGAVLLQVDPMSCPASPATLCDFLRGASGWALCSMLAVMPDMVGVVECLSWGARYGIDLSEDRCSAVPGSRCLLRHLALRVQELVILKTWKPPCID